ncbi:MAG: DUF1461 domain-containing protein [Coriobacteriia bacterium]|nr:DUF1461 domain-containing protein [Coriobacteriia bacterium]
MASADSLMRAARLLEVVVAALMIVLVVVGGSVWLVSTPAYVGVLVRAVDSTGATGLDETVTLEVAEDVRRFVVDPGAPALPAMIGEMPAFDDAAVEHLVDVRDVMVPARWFTLGLLAVVAAWVWSRWGIPGGRHTIARACTTASAIMFGGAVVALAVGVMDFEGLFAWFHSIFFADGTWVFPNGALLIRLFPLPFWIAAGASWGVLVFVCAVTLCTFARCTRFTVGTYGV